ncbi:MAG: class I SAM-dependent methyltransferase [Thermomicrobium sp.]|nr:class I SAM-dependent methyltransferase [Thermomicrobium sp.]MDW7981582.1 class I SAM-dependent methyltransferase [Thermomicrobium sp.]
MVRRPTTERVTPDSWALRVTFWQSLAAYRWASDRAAGLRALDVGCGEGYGTAALAQRSRLVIGMDTDETTLRTARRRYPSDNLFWLRGAADALPIRDQQVDLVCCFQVLEHLARPERFLHEVRRVLAPGGLFLLTTPHRAAVVRGLNPHHVREYDPESLLGLLRSVFDHVELLGVFPSERVASYRAANRRTVERILRWDRLGLYRRLPDWLRDELHVWGTLAVRRWLNRRFQDLVASIGPDDFRIAHGDLAQAIDLAALVRKEPTRS